MNGGDAGESIQLGWMIRQPGWVTTPQRADLSVAEAVYRSTPGMAGQSVVIRECRNSAVHAGGKQGTHPFTSFRGASSTIHSESLSLRNFSLSSLFLSSLCLSHPATLLFIHLFFHFLNKPIEFGERMYVVFVYGKYVCKEKDTRRERWGEMPSSKAGGMVLFCMETFNHFPCETTHMGTGPQKLRHDSTPKPRA